MVYDGGRIETYHHAPDPKRLRLKLHRVQVEQLDTGIGSGWVADVDHGDCSLPGRHWKRTSCGEVSSGFLRNSDRRCSCAREF